VGEDVAAGLSRCGNLAKRKCETKSGARSTIRTMTRSQGSRYQRKRSKWAKQMVETKQQVYRKPMQRDKREGREPNNLRTYLGWGVRSADREL